MASVEGNRVASAMRQSPFRAQWFGRTQTRHRTGRKVKLQAIMHMPVICDESLQSMPLSLIRRSWVV